MTHNSFIYETNFRMYTQKWVDWRRFAQLIFPSNIIIPFLQKQKTTQNQILVGLSGSFGLTEVLLYIWLVLNRKIKQ